MVLWIKFGSGSALVLQVCVVWLAMADDSVIIKRIKKVSGGGHSSAWKVAYADFVTAMMAFFLLMWLLSTATKDQLQGISKYFTPDFGFAGGKSQTQLDRPVPDEGKMEALGGAKENKNGEEQKKDKAKDKDVSIKSTKNDDDAYLMELKGEIENFVSQVYLNSNVSVRNVPDGIAIEIADHQKGNFLFDKNGSKIVDNAKKSLDDLIDLLRYVPRYVSIEGFSAADEDAQWTLSIARAESLRLYLQEKGLTDRVARVAGAGAFELIDKTFPNSPRNRRVVITLLKDSVMPFGATRG